ncbi:MAG: TRAP transporter large permease [Pseudomonadota bacterium]
MTLAALAMIGLCALVAMGVPLVVALAAATVGYFLVTGAWELALAQQTIQAIDDFVLLALPLFVLAGAIMNIGGITARLFTFASALVGHLRGGLAQVNVATSVLFGGMVGTSVADLAGTGSVVIPAMKERGYPASFAAALSASSSGIGPLLPPSSPMILYSAVTGVSLSALFLAGVIPGLLLGATFMALVAYIARRKKFERGPRFDTKVVVRAGVRAILPLGMPVIVLAGLVGGVFTPSEAGAFAVAYGVILAALVMRELNFKRYYRACVETVILTGEIMLVVGLSAALGWALSFAKVPGELVALFDAMNLADSPFLTLLALLAIALLAGMFLDPLIPVIVPILLPTLIALDVDLLHFGVLIVVTVVIGQVTPPVALSLVVASKIARVDVLAALRANTPFLLATIALLLVLMALPGLSTFLPEALR